MSTRYPDIFNALAAEFHPGDVKQRDAGQGRKLSYVTARTVENRLDEVLGWENWDCDLVPVSDHAYKCVMTVTLPDGQRVTKAAIGAKSTMSQKAGGKVDPGDDDKGGDSDAFKRVASKFGVARYLHNDGVMHYADTRDDGLGGETQRAARPGPSKADKLLGWAEANGHMQRARALAKSNYGTEVLTSLDDDQALAIYKLLSQTKALADVPQPEARKPPEQAKPRGPVNENGNPVDFGWPRSGAAMFAWTKNLEGAFKVSLVKAVDDEFCKPGGWSRTWKEWNPEQVDQAAIFVAKRVKTYPGYDGQFDSRIPDTTKLKGDIMAAAAKLLAAHGEAEPTRDQIDHAVAAVVQDLERGWNGETLGDLYESEDAGKLKQVLDQINKDLADSEIPF